MEKTRQEIIKELEQKTFISVYQQEHHPKQPYFVRCVKCGSKLRELKPTLQYEEVYQVLKQHKCHVKN